MASTFSSPNTNSSPVSYRRPRHDDAVGGKAGPSSSFLIAEVNSNDVLFGRGSRSNVHPGNIFFRKLVSNKLKEYTKSTNSRRDKTQISRSIIATIHRHGGRFLREVAVKEAAPSSDVAANNMLVSGHSPSRKGGRSCGATAYYTIITDESVLTRKTRQAFRHFTRCRERERKAAAGSTINNESALKLSAEHKDDDDAEAAAAAVEHPSAPSFLPIEERGDRPAQLLEEAAPPPPHDQPDARTTTTAHRHQHHRQRIPFHHREDIMVEEARGADASATAITTTRPGANTQVWRGSTLLAENLADTTTGAAGNDRRGENSTNRKKASHVCHLPAPFPRSIVARQPQRIATNNRSTTSRRDPHRHAAAIAAALSSAPVAPGGDGGCHARQRDDFVTTQSLAMPLLLQGGWRRQPPNFRQSGVAVEERESIIRAMGGTMQPQPPQPQRQRQRHAHRNRLFAACATRGAAPTLNQLLASSTTRNGGGNGIVKNEDDHGDRSLQQRRQEIIDHAGAPPMAEQRNDHAGCGGGPLLPWQLSSSSPTQGIVYSILDVLTLMAIQETMMKGGTRK